MSLVVSVFDSPPKPNGSNTSGSSASRGFFGKSWSSFTKSNTSTSSPSPKGQGSRAREIQFEVTDTGRGIAPDWLDRVFDPSTQVQQDKASTLPITHVA